MGLFRRRRDADATTDPAPSVPAGPSEIEQLRVNLAAMHERLDAVAAEKAALDAEVKSLTARLATPMPSPSPVSAPAVEQRDIDLLRAQLARIDGRVSDIDHRVGAANDGIAAVTEYVSAVATELANQITELGGEVDALANRPVPESSGPAPVVASVDEEALDELRDAQTRLANEQARYQIAFRQDLAELADRLRRPAP